MKYKTNSWSAVAPVLLCGAAALAVISRPLYAGAQDAIAAPIASSNKLMSARTIRMTGTFSLVDKDSTVKPFFGVTLTADGKSRYRLDVQPLAGQAKTPSFYFTDGVKQYEYNSLRGKYSIEDAPKPGERANSQLYAMAGLSVILTPNAPVRPGETRTTGEEMLDGVKTRTVTDLEPPRKNATGSPISAGTKTWFDAETGLPIRRCDIMIQDGVLRKNLQMDYKTWKFDESVPSELFVWKAPEGATEADTLLAVGTPAPDFAALTAGGKTVHLSDYKGKIVILDFWATWCGPCQRSMPHLQKVYQQVKNKDVAVLALCVWDERAAYDKWLTAKKGVYSFTTAFDPAGRAETNIAKKLYLVDSIPTQYVIDKDGKVAASFIGYEEGSSKLERMLQKLHVDVTVPTAAITETDKRAAK